MHTPYIYMWEAKGSEEEIQKNENVNPTINTMTPSHGNKNNNNTHY